MAHETHFETLHDHSGEDHVLRLKGELDIARLDEVRLALHRVVSDGRPRAVVDLSSVSFLDSSGLKALMDAHQLARTHGIELVLRQPSASVRKVMEVTRTEDFFSFEEPEE
jgi:anti-sigma B factor antagonist